MVSWGQPPKALASTTRLITEPVRSGQKIVAERGDLGGVSMGFVATRDSWAGDLRTLHEVELFEVSIVQAHPAYSDTTVSLRSRSNAGLRADPRIRWLELYP